jgi:hypothetical protein
MKDEDVTIQPESFLFHPSDFRLPTCSYAFVD